MSDYNIEKSVENSIVSKRGHAGSILVSGKKKFYRRKKNKNKKNRNGRKNKNNRNKKKNKNKQNNIEQISVVQNAEALANELSRQGKSAIGPSLNFLTTSKNPSTEPLLPQPNNPKIRTQNSRSFDFRTGRQTNTDKVVVPGFANGLPNGTPEGVKIALASAERGIPKVTQNY